MVKTKQELINLLVQKNGLSKKKNLNFVNVLVDLINETLRDERQLKITGLGTFKVIDVKDRESVNVNTGDRFVIEGRNKITFTPDNAMKELVNRPFSQFETVVLNDGVDFADMPEPVEETEIESINNPTIPVVEDPVVDTPASIVPLVSVADDEADAEEEHPKEIILPEEEHIEEEHLPDDQVSQQEEGKQEPLDDKENHPQEELTEETELNSNQEEINNEETQEEPVMEENKSNIGKWLLALLICTLAGAAGGYYFGKKYGPVKYIPMEKTEMIQGEIVDSTVIDSLYESDSIQKAKDAKIKAKVDSITRAHEARNESVRVAKQRRSEVTTAKMDAATAAKQTAPQSKPAEPAAKPAAQPVALPKGENSQALNNAKQMVSTGAYQIVGTQETITVKAGQTMKKISKFYLGDGMECYIQAYNGVSEVSEGMRLKIPKLQVKKKK